MIHIAPAELMLAERHMDDQQEMVPDKVGDFDFLSFLFTKNILIYKLLMEWFALVLSLCEYGS